MIKIYTNVTTYQNYDANGNPFDTGAPQMFFKGKDTIKWQLCTETPDLADNESPDISWTKCTSYSGINGIGAYLTADDNYTQKLLGSLSNAISPGSISTVSASFQNASFSTIPSSGNLTLFDASGNHETVTYTSRSISGNTVTFTLTAGTTVTGTYAIGSNTDVNEEVYMQSTLDTVNSDVSNGLFVFSITAYSEKLRQEIVYSDTRAVDVKSLELAIFQTVNNVKQDLDRYTVETFTIRSGLVDISDNPQVTSAEQNMLVSTVNTMLASGFEFQFSVDGSTSWHSTQTSNDFYYRIRSSVSGGTWSNAIAILRSPDSIVVKNTMPTASSISDNYVLFLGTTGGGYTSGHLYAKTVAGSTYSYTDKGAMI